MPRDWLHGLGPCYLGHCCKVNIVMRVVMNMRVMRITLMLVVIKMVIDLGFFPGSFLKLTNFMCESFQFFLNVVWLVTIFLFTFRFVDGEMFWTYSVITLGFRLVLTIVSVTFCVHHIFISSFYHIFVILQPPLVNKS